MNKISVSITYDKYYNTKSFICFDGSNYLDYLPESYENTFLLDLINRHEKIVVFDIKQFTKFYSNRNIVLTPEHINKIDSLKLLCHLKDSNNKNLEITDITNNEKLDIYSKRINSFKKIYSKDKYLDFIPDYILRNYNIEITRALFNKKIEIDNTEYYNNLKVQLYYLGKCEQNGIKIIDNSIENIDSFIYPDYEYDSTQTGRLYNRYPVSFQNLAKDDEVRKKFVSRFDGGKFLIADWDSIDLRVAFAMAGESIFTDDLHRDVAKIVLEKEDITDEDRKIIKEINFSIIYGAGLDSVSKKTGIEKEKLVELIQKLFDKFKKLKEFIFRTRNSVLEKGYAESYFGRRRYLKEDEVTKFVNSTIQMTSADICLRAIYGLNFADLAVFKNIPYIVYDRLAIDCKNEFIEEAKKQLNNVMSIYAPGDLTKFVNFPIKIEIRETL